MKNNHSKSRRGGLPPDKYLSEEQVNKLKNHLDDQVETAASTFGKKRAATTRMLIDVLLNSGLRFCEVTKLEMRDLPSHHNKLVINVRSGRFKVSRAVEVSSTLASRLNTYIKTWRKSSKPNSRLFVNENGGALSYRSVHSKLKIVGQKSGIGNLTAHMLRHTFGTYLYRIEKDLYYVQDQLGHAKPETTAIYAKTMSDDRRRQIEKLNL